jgi:hypothetical protein
MAILDILYGYLVLSACEMLYKYTGNARVIKTRRQEISLLWSYSISNIGNYQENKKKLAELSAIIKTNTRHCRFIQTVSLISSLFSNSLKIDYSR